GSTYPSQECCQNCVLHFCWGGSGVCWLFLGLDVPIMKLYSRAGWTLWSWMIACAPDTKGARETERRAFTRMSCFRSAIMEYRNRTGDLPKSILRIGPVHCLQE